MKNLPADAKADALVSAINRGERAIDNIPNLVEQVIEEKAWEHRERGPDTSKTFDSFAEFCKTDPPEGLGCEVQRLVNLCKQDESVQKMVKEEATDELYPEAEGHGGDRKSEDADQVDNINSNDGGDSESYVVRRLKRDHPELAEKVLADEMSANQAAIEAGFRDKKASIPIHKGGEPQVERAAKSLANHFDEHLDALINELQRHA